MFGPDAVHGEIETMLRPILRGTFYYIGCDVLPPFIAWHVPYVTEEARRRYLTAYREHLRRLEEMRPLRFPSLDRFDERFYPIREVNHQ